MVYLHDNLPSYETDFLIRMWDIFFSQKDTQAIQHNLLFRFLVNISFCVFLNSAKEYRFTIPYSTGDADPMLSAYPRGVNCNVIKTGVGLYVKP